jgi:hypothetical protein
MSPDPIRAQDGVRAGRVGRVEGKPVGNDVTVNRVAPESAGTPRRGGAEGDGFPFTRSRRGG